MHPVSNIVESLLDKTAQTLKELLSVLFQAETDQRRRWVVWTWFGLMFLGGVLAWSYFFSLGHFPYHFHDWAAVSEPRFTFLKEAVATGQLPFHAASQFAPSQTNRYLAIPDAFLSPQALLLRFLSVGQFVLVDVILMYAIGFWGLLLLKRQLRLSPVAATVVFLLFNFNGHILAHLSVGHATWGGYFLFPWFVHLVLRLIDGKASWRWVAGMALLLAAMYLQGSFHQVVYCLLFLGFMAITSRRLFLPALGGAIAGLSVCLFRILPPTLLLSQFDNGYRGGYADLFAILDALTRLQNASQSVAYSEAYLGVWETSLYIGILGTLFLAYFGIYRWGRGHIKNTPYRQLILPMAALSVLSLGIVFGWLRALNLPMLSGERVASRILSLPFTFLVVIAASEFQHWIESFPLKNPIGQAAVLVLVAAQASDLARNLTIWKMSEVAPVFPVEKFDPTTWAVVTVSDPDYTRLIVIGAVISLLSLVGLLFLAWREERKKRLPSLLQDSSS